MITAEDIQLLARSGEGYNVEFKVSVPSKVRELTEAIINSLSHRDYYDKGATTTIELFDDRIEITNPGGLVILELIEHNTTITLNELMKATHLTKRKVEYQINKLKKNKHIKRIGPNKGGYWQVNTSWSTEN